MYQNGTYIGINKTKNFLFGTLHNSMLNKKINIIETKGYGIHTGPMVTLDDMMVLGP